MVDIKFDELKLSDFEIYNKLISEDIIYRDFFYYISSSLYNNKEKIIFEDVDNFIFGYFNFYKTHKISYKKNIYVKILYYGFIEYKWILCW
jgi:hypothetical protein